RRKRGDIHDLTARRQAPLGRLCYQKWARKVCAQCSLPTRQVEIVERSRDVSPCVIDDRIKFSVASDSHIERSRHLCFAAHIQLNAACPSRACGKLLHGLACARLVAISCDHAGALLLKHLAYG